MRAKKNNIKNIRHYWQAHQILVFIYITLLRINSPNAASSTSGAEC
jgi:hypothetical protein